MSLAYGVKKRNYMPVSGDEWTDEELNAATAAYLEMLENQQSGRKYSKASYRRQLIDGPLSGRSESSVEYRMQNISAAMEELCFPTVQGYPPAKNVGTNVKDRIRRCVEALGVINDADYIPEADSQSLERKTAKLLERTLVGKPRGQAKPVRTEASSQTFQRDPLVRAWVLQQAKGVCECCGKPSPFTLADGTPFLEVHHVKPLSDGGSDRVENAIAACPNCHRELHLGVARESVKARLYEQHERLEKE